MKAILLDEAKKWLEENCENQYTRMAVFGIMQSMPTVDYQKTPNEPLTLEQLREMDGEPVWVVPRGTHEKDEPMWCVLESPMALIPGVDYWSWDFDGYAETWIAYRRPLEGEA